jgi:hypothetical protein
LSYYDENAILINEDEIKDKNHYKSSKQSDYTEEEIEEIIFKRNKFIGSFKNYNELLKKKC